MSHLYSANFFQAAYTRCIYIGIVVGDIRFEQSGLSRCLTPQILLLEPRLLTERWYGIMGRSQGWC
jgi:hypothetical protein